MYAFAGTTLGRGCHSPRYCRPDSIDGLLVLVDRMWLPDRQPSDDLQPYSKFISAHESRIHQSSSLLSILGIARTSPEEYSGRCSGSSMPPPCHDLSLP